VRRLPQVCEAAFDDAAALVERRMELAGRTAERARQWPDAASRLSKNSNARCRPFSCSAGFQPALRKCRLEAGATRSATLATGDEPWAPGR
jgi:hypothetical protein